MKLIILAISIMFLISGCGSSSYTSTGPWRDDFKCKDIDYQCVGFSTTENNSKWPYDGGLVDYDKCKAVEKRQYEDCLKRIKEYPGGESLNAVIALDRRNLYLDDLLPFQVCVPEPIRIKKLN